MNTIICALIAVIGSVIGNALTPIILNRLNRKDLITDRENDNQKQINDALSSYAAKLDNVEEKLGTKMDNIRKQSQDRYTELQKSIDITQDQSTQIEIGLQSSRKEICSKISYINDRLSAHDDAFVTLFHDRLYHDINRCLTQGYTTQACRMNIAKMFEQYSALGGNGDIKQLYEGKFQSLPIQENK